MSDCVTPTTGRSEFLLILVLFILLVIVGLDWL